jgi:hypothetical protein
MVDVTRMRTALSLSRYRLSLFSLVLLTMSTTSTLSQLNEDKGKSAFL